MLKKRQIIPSLLGMALFCYLLVPTLLLGQQWEEDPIPDANADSLTNPVEFKTGTVVANGLQFSFLELGEGPLILALHGFPDHARSFRHQMPALADAGYRVVAPYMRGYAPTDAPADAPYDYGVLVQDTLALIDALGGESTILIGHDFGAVAAYGAAALASEKVTKLITIASPYGGFYQSLMLNPEEQRRKWYMFYFQSFPGAETAVALDDFAFIERLWKDWSPGWRIPKEEMAAVKETLSKPGVLTAALTYYHHIFNPIPASPEIQEIRDNYGGPIKVPTLYIYGKRDGCVGLEVSEGMEDLFPLGLRKELILGAGHFVHQQRPMLVNRLILKFLLE